MTPDEAIAIVTDRANGKSVSDAIFALAAATLVDEVKRRPKLVVVDMQQPESEFHAGDLPRFYGSELTRPIVTIKLTTGYAEYTFNAVPTGSPVALGQIEYLPTTAPADAKRS